MPELTIVALSILERYINDVRYANADVSPCNLPFGNLLLFTLIYNYHLLPTSSRFSVHTPLWHCDPYSYWNYKYHFEENLQKRWERMTSSLVNKNVWCESNVRSVKHSQLVARWGFCSLDHSWLHYDDMRITYYSYHYLSTDSKRPVA